MTPGNVKEVAAMSLTLQESEIQKAVVVADKGFFSEKNMKMLDDKKLQYIDRSYMRSNEMLEAWLFINHLALIFYYRLYKRLIQHDMLKKI